MELAATATAVLLWKASKVRADLGSRGRRPLPSGDSRSSASAWGATAPPDWSVAHFRRGCGAAAHGRGGAGLAPHPIIGDSYGSSDDEQEQERRRQTRSHRHERHHAHTLHQIALDHQQDSLAPVAVSAWRRSGVPTPGISGREVMPLIVGKPLRHGHGLVMAEVASVWMRFALGARHWTDRTDSPGRMDRSNFSYSS